MQKTEALQKAGEEHLTEEGLLHTLQTFQEENGVRERLRTNFRRIILNELISGPGARPSNNVTITGRAIGSLFVEWLKSYNCHYTICMLTSEMPSLSDLPELHNPDPSAKYGEEYVTEILNVLHLEKEEIFELYGNSSHSLLSCILDFATKWRQRLSFKFSCCSNHDEDTDEKWCHDLRDILSAVSISPVQLPRLHESINGLVKKIVNEAIQKERESYNNELLLREKKLQDYFKIREDRLESKLEEMEHGFHEMDQYDVHQLEHWKEVLYKLFVEVKEQHQVVLDALTNLEEQEIDLEKEKNEWKAFVAEEKRIIDERSGMLDIKETELGEERNKISAALQQLGALKSKIKERERSDQAIQTDLVMDRGNERKDTNSRHSGIPRPVNLKQRLKDVFEEELLSPISDLAFSNTNEDNDAHTIPYKRLQELREEGRRAAEDYVEYCKRSEDTDSNSSMAESNLQMPHLLNSLRKHRLGLNIPQVYFPSLHEGVHSVPPIPRRHHRLASIFGQSEQNTTSPSVTMKAPQEATPFLVSEAYNETKDRIMRLEHIIQSIRTESPEQGSERQKVQTANLLLTSPKLNTSSDKDASRINNEACLVSNPKTSSNPADSARDQGKMKLPKNLTALAESVVNKMVVQKSPLLRQAVLTEDSDLSEGEVLSVGSEFSKEFQLW